MFATAGLTGATTREIARVAAVNEVTLYRHFQNKEQLLAAVITEAIALQAQALADHDNWTQNLYIDLKNDLRLCNQMMEEHEDLIRIFIGEAKRHPQAARLILYDTDKSLPEQLVVYRRLRFSDTPTTLGYSRECYIETCVNLFVRGISSLPLKEAGVSVDSPATR